MGWYIKNTSIKGYDTEDPGPPPGIERLAWGETHRRLIFRRGHWSPDACLRAGRKAGIVGDVTVEHTTSDLNGKGYGGIDRRFSINEAGVTEITIPAEQNRAWSDIQSADAWEST